MLTPADIDNKQFGTTRLKEGYDQDEVDGFLDAVKDDYAFLQAAVNRLDDENRTLRRQAELRSKAETTVLPTVAPETPSAIIEKMLAAAETAAREHEAEARARADVVVREAAAEGARAVEEAQAAAERIKSEGMAEKYRRVEELEQKTRQVQAALENATSAGTQARRALLAAQAAYDKEMTL